MLGRDIANVSNLDLVLHHASEDLSQTATSGGSESRKRRAMIRTNSNSSREKETSSKTCHVSNIFPSALLPQVVSRGDWQKNQYRSFVPFLHTLVPYPNQRRKSSIFRIFRHHHTSWPEMVMEKFVGIRPQTGSGIREGGDGRVD